MDTTHKEQEQNKIIDDAKEELGEMLDNLDFDIENIDVEALKKLFFSAIDQDFANAKGDINFLDFNIKNYLLYASSVIAGRALPHLKDGLKPVHRRVLFSMNQIGLKASGRYAKGARVVGDTIGKYHPHGDTSVYEALVILAQDFKMRMPLAQGQGNWGSIDGDNAAAMRYTEVRMSLPSEMMFADVNFDTIEFRPNYDGYEDEPLLLPAPFPNILINGIPSGSIAVGMASSMLQHNPDEVMAAMIKVIQNKRDEIETTVDDIFACIPAPDFPTGGFVYDLQDFKTIIETGKGKVRVRAKHHIEELSRNRTQIVITELPWGMVKLGTAKKTGIIPEIINIKKKSDKDDKIARSIMRVNDQSDKNGLRICVEIQAGFDPEIIWNRILKETKLDTSLAYFTVVLDDAVDAHGEAVLQPKDMGLLEVLTKYVDFRFETYLRKQSFLEKKYFDRIHILDGLLKAIDMIDTIITLVKGSKDNIESKSKLLELGFSEPQAEAIIAMRLGRLSNAPKGAYIEERAELNDKRDYCLRIINEPVFCANELIKETEIVAKKIAQPRRTVIKPELSGNLDMEDLITKEECLIYLTEKGYVKRVTKKEINSQNRGTQGKKGMQLSDGDFVQKMFNTSTHSTILFVMNSGNVYGTKAYNVPDSNRGSFIENLFELKDGEKIVNVIEVDTFEDKNLLMLTKNGMIKSSEIKHYVGSVRKSGIKGLNLKDGDTVCSIKLVDSNSTEDIVIATTEGIAIRFNIDSISVTGRASSGVKAIKLNPHNHVIGSAVLSEDTIVATISENGMVKLSKEDAFKTQARAGKGVKCMNLTDKSGKLISILSWNTSDEFDIITLTKNGVLNRIPMETIRTTSRNTKGVKLIDIRDGDQLATVLKAIKEEVGL